MATKREAYADSREVFEPMLHKIGVDTDSFPVEPKMVYGLSVPTHATIGIFGVNINKSICIELMNDNWEPVHVNPRKLFLYEAVPEGEAIPYPVQPYSGSTVPLYKILIATLQEIDFTVPEPPEPVRLSMADPLEEDPLLSLANPASAVAHDTDESVDTLTIRDQYAITHSVPLSNKQWINTMIRQGNELRFEQSMRHIDRMHPPKAPSPQDAPDPEPTLELFPSPPKPTNATAPAIRINDTVSPVKTKRKYTPRTKAA